jgi:hypothetical protein
MKPKRKKAPTESLLVIGDPALEASMRRFESLKQLVVERGHFTKSEHDIALGYCTIDQAKLVGINVAPDIGEKVALWLIGELQSLREREKQVGSAPVLSGKTMSRLDIADLAMTMLESCEDRPGELLTRLLQQLLDVDRHRKALAGFRDEKFDSAVQIDAQLSLEGRAPSAYRLARYLSVSPTTVIAWRQLPEYHLKQEALMKSWRYEFREFLEEVKVGAPNLGEHQAFRRAFEMYVYKQNWAKRGIPEF